MQDFRSVWECVQILSLRGNTSHGLLPWLPAFLIKTLLQVGNDSMIDSFSEM